MGAVESGRDFLQGFISKLPENLRAEGQALVEKVLANQEAVPAVQYVGDGAMARPDYSRAMNEVKTKEGELQQKLDNLTNWYTENRAALEEYLVIKPEYETLRTTRPPAQPPAPPSPAPPADPRRVVEEVLQEQGRDYVQLSAWLAGKAVEHFHQFGEPLNVLEITSDPRLGRPINGQPGRVFSLLDAYSAKYGERVAQKEKEAVEKKFNDEVERRMKDERAKQSSLPFPLRSESPSVLDVLATKEGPASHTLDSAVAEYERLQAARGTG